MARKIKPKISKTFRNILFIISAIGFTSIILKFYGIFDFDQYIVWITTLLLGAGLMVEGGLRTIIKYFDKGLTMVELTHIFASLIGLIVFISGIIGVVRNALPEQLKGIVGTVYILALAVTIIERYV